MKSERVYTDKTKARLFTDNLIGGIGWGIGSIIGAVTLVTLFGLIAARIQAVPVVGEFVFGVIQEVNKLQGK